MMRIMIRFYNTEELVKGENKKLFLKEENQFEITDFIMKMRLKM